MPDFPSPAPADWLNRCHAGDCREAMKAWPSAAADACITDPPYGDTSLDWDRRCAGWMAEVARVSLNEKSVYLGVYETPELAQEAYVAAKRRLHAGCTI